MATLVYQGKTRDVYDAGRGQLLMVASDRVSAFDAVLPNKIPHKGAVLTQLSAYWFQRTRDIIQNHFVELVDERSMRVLRCKPLYIECIVRGYLKGSAWKEYQKGGSVCGIQLPPGLQQGDKLPSPIFTPSTKALEGHDENITLEEAESLVGGVLQQIAQVSLQLYQFACDHLAPKGLLVYDTKFEFGTRDGQLMLMDELLTPDSTRFSGGMDKQEVRDFVSVMGTLLPPRFVQEVSANYLRLYRIVTGSALGSDRYIKRGSFVLSSGAVCPFYVDLKAAWNCSVFMDQLRRHIGLLPLPRDHFVVTGVPYGGSFFSVGMVQQWRTRGDRVDIMFIRKVAKDHGTGSRIEYDCPTEQRGDRPVVLVEDVVTSGQSVLDTIDLLKRSGYTQINRVVVVLDRCQGGVERLRGLGYIVDTLFRLTGTGGLTDDPVVLEYVNHP